MRAIKTKIMVGPRNQIRTDCWWEIYQEIYAASSGVTQQPEPCCQLANYPVCMVHVGSRSNQRVDDTKI